MYFCFCKSSTVKSERYYRNSQLLPIYFLKKYVCAHTFTSITPQTTQPACSPVPTRWPHKREGAVPLNPESLQVSEVKTISSVVNCQICQPTVC